MPPVLWSIRCAWQMAGSKKREGSVPLVDEVGGPQETLKELTFEWNPEIWEKEEKLCWEQWDWGLKVGRWWWAQGITCSPTRLGHSCQNAVRGQKWRKCQQFWRALNTYPKKGCPENNFRFFTDKKRKVQKDDWFPPKSQSGSWVCRLEPHPFAEKTLLRTYT